MSKTVPSDIEIAQAANVEPIEAIAEKMGLVRQDIELYIARDGFRHEKILSILI